MLHRAPAIDPCRLGYFTVFYGSEPHIRIGPAVGGRGFPHCVLLEDSSSVLNLLTLLRYYYINGLLLLLYYTLGIVGVGVITLSPCQSSLII